MNAALSLLLVVLGQTSSAPFIRSRTRPMGTEPTHCLYWTNPVLEWRQSAAGNPDTPGTDEFEAVRASFTAWQAVFAECGNMDFREGPLSDARQSGYMPGANDNENVVLFRVRSCAQVAPAGDACWTDGSCGNAYDCWEHDDRTIAVTATTYDQKSGIIYDSDVELNAAPQRGGKRFVFSATSVPSCGGVSSTECIVTDTRNTVTHEVGHLLGLDHTLAAGSTMNASAPEGDISKRTVDPGSGEFVCRAYPRGLPSQDCIQLAPEATLGPSTGGCAGAGPVLVPAWALLTLIGWLTVMSKQSPKRRRPGGFHPAGASPPGSREIPRVGSG